MKARVQLMGRACPQHRQGPGLHPGIGKRRKWKAGNKEGRKEGREGKRGREGRKEGKQHMCKALHRACLEQSGGHDE
jgi:hypothetical protein